MQNTKQYQCEFCKKSFTAQYLVNRHQKSKKCKTIQEELKIAKQIIEKQQPKQDKKEIMTMIEEAFIPEKFTLDHYQMGASGCANYMKECLEDFDIVVCDPSRGKLKINDVPINADTLIPLMAKKNVKQFSVLSGIEFKKWNTQQMALTHTKRKKSEYEYQMDIEKYEKQLEEYNHWIKTKDCLKERFIKEMVMELGADKFNVEQHEVSNDPELFNDVKINATAQKLWATKSLPFTCKPICPNKYEWVLKAEYENDDWDGVVESDKPMPDMEMVTKLSDIAKGKISKLRAKILKCFIQII